MGSVARMTKPYRAAMKGKWQEVETFYENHNVLVRAPLTVTRDTALHLAVHYENTDSLDILLRIWRESPFFQVESTPYQIKNGYGHTALHEAAAAGNLEAAKLLLTYDKGLLPIPNHRGETALFCAAAFGRTNVVKFLASKDQVKEPPHVKRKDKTSILHIAILGRYFETAVELLKLGISPLMLDEDGMTGFQLLANMPSAFKSGYPMSKLKALIYYCLPKVDYVDNEKEEIDSGQLVVVGEKNQDLETGHVTKRPYKSTQAADSPSVISSAYNTFWRSIARGFPSVKEVWNDKKNQTKALELAMILAETDLSWQYLSSGGPPSEPETDLSWQYLSSGGPLSEPISTYKDDEEGDEGEKKEDKGDDNRHQPTAASQPSFPSETPLLAAARNGIVEIVDAILKVYPQAIEHVNHKKENIFHVVAKHHRTKILDLLQHPAVVFPKSRLLRNINDDGDSILHSAAYFGDFPLRDRPGEALQMQSDIQWFKRVQKIVPVYFINHRNNDKKTAHELFTEKHKQLVHDGQEWLTRTAQACTIVAVLIATVAFTCAYTVPGGSNKAGRPLLLKTTPFSVFATSDALSLCFSLTSVVVFLSIMTSRMHEQDFKMSLPLKLVLGLTTLCFSVTAMMVAFSATLVLMIRQSLHWAAIPIYTIAFFPVTIFLILQCPLYFNIAWFTVKDLFAG